MASLERLTKPNLVFRGGAVLAIAGAVLFSARLASAQNASSAAASPALRISQVSPTALSPGTRAALKISGQGFAQGAYVGFSGPGIRVVSTQRKSDTELQASVEVGDKAEPGAITLYVSNPDGTAAQTIFTILGPSPAVSPSSVGKPGEIQTGAADSPKVTAVVPSHAAPAINLKIKVKGENFVKGAKVAFSNPGIEVLQTDFHKSTELEATLQVAPDAPTGPCSLFVINPDENEVEVGFEIEGKTVATSQTSASKATSGSTVGKSGAPTASSQQFNVINLGDAISALSKSGKAQGVLILTGKKLEYDEAGKKVFSVGLSEIQEVAPNVFFGINTETFHIILTSGKSYNFTAASFSPSDTQSILKSLESALH